MQKQNEIVKKIRISLYPFTILITTPVRLLQALWGARILAKGRWRFYSGFQTTMAVNALAYWIFALNLYRHGRNGYSKSMGSGSFPLTTLTHYTNISLFSYWSAGAVVMLLGVFGWWCSSFIWFSGVDDIWLLLCLLLMTVISTTFYSNAFVFQNYNALGWIFFPLGLYGMYHDCMFLSLLAWLGASFMSTTVVFLAGIVSVVVSLMTGSLYPVFSLLPAVLKLATHFWPSLIQGDARKVVFAISQSVGLYRKKTKYIMRLRLGKDQYYHIFLMAQFILVLLLGFQHFAYLTATGLLIYLVNSRFSRFSDPQTIQMFIMSLALVDAIQADSFWILPSYWLMVSPLPLKLRIPAERKAYDIVPKVKPFSIRVLLERLEKFVDPISSGKRVLIAFKDPENEYGRIYDGQQILIQPLFYTASLKDILMLPNFWAVNDVDYPGGPGFWGRTPEQVKENVLKWEADFVILYTYDSQPLETTWKDNGFSIVGSFDWKDQEDQLHGIQPYSGPCPKWWIVVPPMLQK